MGCFQEWVVSKKGLYTKQHIFGKHRGAENYPFLTRLSLPSRMGCCVQPILENKMVCGGLVSHTAGCVAVQIPGTTNPRKRAKKTRKKQLVSSIKNRETLECIE